MSCAGPPLVRRRALVRRANDGQAQALDPLLQVRGLAFLGFPLHPAGKPGIERAEHLAQVQIPMLFVSATMTRSPNSTGEARGRRGSASAQSSTWSRTPIIAQGAAKSGRTPAEAEAEALDALAGWMLERA